MIQTFHMCLQYLGLVFNKEQAVNTAQIFVMRLCTERCPECTNPSASPTVPIGAPSTIAPNGAASS